VVEPEELVYQEVLVVEDFMLQMVVIQVMQVDLQFQKVMQVEHLLLPLLLMVVVVVVEQPLLVQVETPLQVELEAQEHLIQF
tara:strand:- start:227 stop:472 length:246 start_codon:yes stop_codon:yes gene_type:complete